MLFKTVSALACIGLYKYLGGYVRAKTVVVVTYLFSSFDALAIFESSFLLENLHISLTLYTVMTSSFLDSWSATFAIYYILPQCA